MDTTIEKISRTIEDLYTLCAAVIDSEEITQARGLAIIGKNFADKGRDLVDELDIKNRGESAQ
ncbi:hypothetical protein [Microbulbifer halophilus]|uniref:Uncharacterized protein n=1 Tax=Microbulbifer halophilus TaxID=453963 RepID=A0ABW5EAQ0_9GAMM|nr:hypothetical protein [Microbulbifer halophilus]MCW8125762.1 hypothetical protein [Microbulbifer halophilus]